MSKEELFDAHGHLGKNNGRNPSCGTHCQRLRGRNSRNYDAFVKDELFEEGGFVNHGQQGNCNGRTIPPGAAMGGKRSGDRHNRGCKISMISD